MWRTDGGLTGVVIGYIVAQGEILFVFNAPNRLDDVAFFAQQRDRLQLDVELVDRTLETALIGVQGPHAQDMLQPLCSADLGALPGYAFLWADLTSSRALVSRT